MANYCRAVTKSLRGTVAYKLCVIKFFMHGLFCYYIPRAIIQTNVELCISRYCSFIRFCFVLENVVNSVNTPKCYPVVVVVAVFIL
jgi:hypothetical protein